MEIEKVVKLAIKGDEKAFSQIMDISKESLYKTAYAYVKNEDDALDIVQETVYKAYISIEKLKKPQYFKTWITKILINTAIDVSKKKNNLIYMESTDYINAIEDNEESKINKLYLWEAIDKLDEKHRDVIILKYFNDLTIQEISEILNCPIGTVKTHLNKGLCTLRKIVCKEDV